MNPIGKGQHARHLSDAPTCSICRDGDALDFDFSFAFQPIIDIRARTVFAHEALVRGPRGEGAQFVLDQVTAANRYRFDQACRVKAIKTAARLGLASKVSINFLPNAIYRPEVCISTTLKAAQEYGFPVDRIVFETVEGEQIEDGKWLADVFREYQRIGFMTAIDDFGAGYAGLNLLADFQPDIIKLDMALVRNIASRNASQTIVRSVADICRQLGIQLIAEGVETLDEYLCLQDIGVELMQGYLLCKPLLENSLHDAEAVLPR
ncbi:diguanylate phosphodiesterase [Pseudogulbenkiania sp. NH8B]|uniref:EAL domain-containing protein n=1 Tax=Pseudogulbenkiania sp. (strain NH8B) TaxID=748280 RepID=UPI0002279F86|nr:EAL domain-containing protein [Pseudogulbenkiania sp. NH8B]BAK77225.1 diguanylate phosphodiesterase [Pseudogulbenkiania sp. NH8B]